MKRRDFLVTVGGGVFGSLWINSVLNFLAEQKALAQDINPNSNYSYQAVINKKTPSELQIDNAATSLDQQ